MRIGELAARTKMTTTTLRYYEERGLLQRPERTAAGYRTYSEDIMSRLQFIDRARAAGLTLSQTATILGLRDAGRSPCTHVQELLDERLVQIDEQISQLRLLRSSIAKLRSNAAQTTAEACTPESVCRYL